MTKGYIHRTAVIGAPPEMQDWDQSKSGHYPDISYTARINAFCTVDSGVDKPTYIGHNVFLLAHAHVGHDAWIGSDVTLSTGVIIGGYGEVGTGSKLGLGAVVLPYRKIGKGCTIGAGAVVTKNVPDGETWVGNPAVPLAASDPRPFSQRHPAPLPPAEIRAPKGVGINEFDGGAHNEVFLEVLNRQLPDGQR